jgi:hypothetical protein
MAVTVLWLLLVQGTGPSSSAITEIGHYEDRASCERDAAEMKKVFFVITLCLKVTGPQGVR